MKTVSTKSLHPTARLRRGIGKLGGVLAVVLGLAALLIPATAPAQSASLGYSSGNSTTNGTGPGIKLDLSAIPAFEAADAWALTSFTWLSTGTSGAHATGRGYILIFDAELFVSPANMTYSTVNATTTGLVATSNIWDSVAGSYSFTTPVVLDANKTYYILNSAAITTGTTTPAPYSFGFSDSASLPGIERWRGDASAWGATASTGAPNFAATFAPIPEPASAAALLGLFGLGCCLFKRRR